MDTIYIAPQILQDSENNNQIPQSFSESKEHIQWVSLKSGIQLLSMDYTPRNPVAVKYAPPFTPLSFYFSLSGCSRVQSGKNEFDARPGLASFSSYPEPDNARITEIFGTERLVRVGIFMDWEQFKSFGEDQIKSLTTHLSPPAIEMLGHEGQITSAIGVIVSQIINCPYQGLARSFFLESKVLELIAHKIGQIEAGDSMQANGGFLFSSDVERVRKAAHLLTRDLENPPDMTSLARSVGLSRSSLYRHFQKVHGLSPFDYLRNHRMKTAMELLKNREANVSEAAFLVGYSNMSHFSKAFKSMFAVSPSEFLKNSSRLYLT